jgi:hypothetical protein
MTIIVLTAPRKRYVVIPPAMHHQNNREIFSRIEVAMDLETFPLIQKIYAAP